MRLRTLVSVVALAAGLSASAQTSPLDSLTQPPAALAERYAARDVALEVIYAPDGTLLSWRCAIAPHPAFCAPTAAVAAWHGAPTWDREGQPDVFRLPVSFWLPEAYDRDLSGAAPLMTVAPRDRLSPWRDRTGGPSSELVNVIEDAPVLLGGLSELQNRILWPADLARADSLQGRMFVQFVVDERGRVLDDESGPAQCIRSAHPRLCDQALRAVRLARFVPGRLRGVPVRVRYSLPVVFRLDDGAP